MRGFKLFALLMGLSKSKKKIFFTLFWQTME